ncbi:class I SAM-dependent methyltransferase [Candidatus Woesearchaeota archaeon]|nr:class I SAM-dependent methyltransferase [Candidatus Woesearchaeota archaeon]
MTKNSFGKNIPEIKKLFKDFEIENYIRKTLISVLNYLEIEDSESVVEFAIKEAKSYDKLENYERKVHQLFDQKRITQGIPVKLGNRANLIFNQIKNFIQGHQILDLGCGDGKVGELIAKSNSRQVILADVYRNGNISNLELPFVLINQKGKIPFYDNMFDTTLLLTVLHHSDNPVEVIKEAVRVTKNSGKIIVIESVYGVDKYDNLNEEQQRLVNIFFDHFYNRVIHFSEFEENKVNVPFNFQTPQSWKKFFAEHKAIENKMVELGFDQKVVPEYHTLHILEVKK